MSFIVEKPLVLIILDGFGIAPNGEGNPVTGAYAPIIKSMIWNYPTVTLLASGEAVGTDWGEQGNSEVGHLTIGAGRTLFQTFPRINLAIEGKDFFRNPALTGAFAHARSRGSTLHIAGILSHGNVHGSEKHIHALLRMARQQRVQDVAVHVFLDGRDVAFDAGLQSVLELQKLMKKMLLGRIASVSGRFYAMDRDHRWERTERCFRAMTGAAATATDPAQAIRDAYASSHFDEEFEPVVIVDRRGPVGPVRDGDALILTNFRADRTQQIAAAFADRDFAAFPRERFKDLSVVAMADYEMPGAYEIAFPKEEVTNCLAKVISDHGLRQLHVAETEKYAHVTFFLNGLRVEPFPGEDRVIVPSPKVDSYAKVPKMAAEEITRKVLDALEKGGYDFIVTNFANPDMVGHTGDFEPTKKAVEAVDTLVGKIVDATLEKGGVAIITGDHGNAEEVVNPRTGKVDKEHSTNPVPFVVASKRWKDAPPPSGEFVNDAVIAGDLSLLPPVGMLTDVAPTILRLLDIPKPAEMTGNSLL